VILTRLRFNEANGIPHEIGFIAIKICLSEESNERRPGFELLEAEFFDDELIVVIYRLRSKDSK
jgi:anaphase-promoting complex subunit 4